MIKRNILRDLFRTSISVDFGVQIGSKLSVKLRDYIMLQLFYRLEFPLFQRQLRSQLRRNR